MMLTSFLHEGGRVEVNIPILVYHQIEPVADRGIEKRGLVVDASTFRKQMSLLRSFGYSSIGFDDLMLILEGKAKRPRRVFILSFDDGYQGVYEYAYPILREYGFSATIFCIAEDLTRTGVADPPRAFRTLNRDEVQELLRAGFSLGSHSFSHCDLVSVSAEEAQKEISVSRTTLEDMFGVRVSSFAYPYGRHTSTIERMVEDNGYSVAVSTAFGKIHELKDRFRLKRLPIGFDQGLVGYVSRFLGCHYF